MRRRQPLPTLWLMTDERGDASLDAALHRLPRGAGVIFRHYSLPLRERRMRYEQVRVITRRRGLRLILAGTPAQAIAWRADGVHDRGPYGPTPRRLLRTTPAHNLAELVRARSADAVFLSPLFQTRSHPGAATLGRARFGLLARRSGVAVIALGGVNARRARSLSAIGARGWAAIDAWIV
jgi:thiamine-phosphate pyrophosphorylase